MYDEESLKLRYRCPSCKNLESHHANYKKRKCEKCGTVLTEITEKDYRHYKSKLKKKEEDKKEKKKRKSNEDEDNSDNDRKKEKRKLKRNLSTKNIEDKNYKLKKEDKETEDDLNMSEITSKGEHKHKKKNRVKSIEKLGPILSKVVNNILKGGKHLEKGLKKLEKIDFSKYSGTEQTNISINHYNDRPTQIYVNDKKIVTDSFDPIFEHFPEIFGYDFQTNFMQNFISTNQEYFENNTNVYENYDDEDDEENEHRKPLKEESLAKLKKFKLTDKYCQKTKDGKLELPCCCIKDLSKLYFYHKKECKGILLKGTLMNKGIIFCNKCHSINFEDKFNWICPICGIKFHLHNIIGTKPFVKKKYVINKINS